LLKGTELKEVAVCDYTNPAELIELRICYVAQQSLMIMRTIIAHTFAQRRGAKFARQMRRLRSYAVA
jgi:hypothetical protein